MGYERRDILRADIHFNMDREREYCLLVAESRSSEEVPGSIGEALSAYRIEAAFDDDGTSECFELVDWTWVDGWSEDLYDNLAPFVGAGDYIELLHIDEDGEVDHFRIVFDGGGWGYQDPRWD